MKIAQIRLKQDETKRSKNKFKAKCPKCYKET